jgi:uncharacterized protein (TIGR00297 family)
MPFDVAMTTFGRLAVALAAGGAFAFGARRAGLLTRAASCWAGALGAEIVGLGGAAWTAPVLVFFGTSAGLSRLEARGMAREVDDGPRDARQVGANGGVAGALLGAVALGVAPAALCFWGFVGAFAAAAADTWATEVGRRFGGAPFSLRAGRRVEAGASGAVSSVGTLAAAGGALAVSASAGLGAGEALLPPGVGTVRAVIGTAGAGLLGAFTDSLAGAFLQARCRPAKTGRLVEAPRPPAGARNRRVQGLPFLTNDGVNVLCTAVGAAAAMIGVSVL